MPQYPYAPMNQQPITAVTLTAASTNGASAALTNNIHSGVQVFIDITALSGTTPTLTVDIQQKNLVTGTYTTVLASAALSATGVTTLTVYPGATASANVAISDPLGLDWQIAYTISGTAPAVTGTISYAYLV